MNPNNNNNGQDNAPVIWPILDETTAQAPASTEERLQDVVRQEVRMSRRLRRNTLTWNGHPIKKVSNFRVIEFNGRPQINSMGIPIHWEDCPSTVARRQYFETQGRESMNLFMCLSAFMDPYSYALDQAAWNMIRNGLAQGSTQREEAMAWTLIMYDWNTNMEVFKAMEQLELRELEATLTGSRKVPTTMPWNHNQQDGEMNVTHEVTLHAKDANTWEQLATAIMMKYQHRKKYMTFVHFRCRDIVQNGDLDTLRVDEIMYAIKQGVYMVAAMHYRGIPEMKRRVATVWTDMMNNMGRPIGNRQRLKEILEAQLEEAPEAAGPGGFLMMPAISLPAYYGGAVQGQTALPEHVAVMLHFEKFVVSEQSWEGVPVTADHRIYPLQLWSREQVRKDTWKFKLQLRVREELKGRFGWRLIGGTYYKVTVKIVTGVDPIDELPNLLLPKPTYNCQQDGSGYSETVLLEIIAQNQAISRTLTEEGILRVNENIKHESIRARQNQQDMPQRDQQEMITDLPRILHEHKEAITDDMKAAMRIRYQNSMTLLRALSTTQRRWMSFVKQETLGRGIEREIMIRFIRRILNWRVIQLFPVPQVPMAAAQIAVGAKVARFLATQGHDIENIGWDWDLDDNDLEEAEEEQDPDDDEEAEDDDELEDDDHELEDDDDELEEDEESNYEGMDSDEREELEHERDVVVPFLREWNHEG